MQRPLLIAFSLLALLFAGCGEDAEKGGGSLESGKTNKNYWEGTFADYLQMVIVNFRIYL